MSPKFFIRRPDRRTSAKLAIVKIFSRKGSGWFAMTTGHFVKHVWRYLKVFFNNNVAQNWITCQCWQAFASWGGTSTCKLKFFFQMTCWSAVRWLIFRWSVDMLPTQEETTSTKQAPRGSAYLSSNAVPDLHRWTQHLFFCIKTFCIHSVYWEIKVRLIVSLRKT